jgi:hypothetical protein
MPLLDHLGMILSSASAPAQGDMIVRGPSGGWTTLPLGDPNNALVTDEDTGLPMWKGLTGVGGPQGIQGIQGIQGPTGAVGPQGQMGPPSSLFDGDWAGGTTYAQWHWVFGSDKLPYISLIAGNVGNNPTIDDGTHWACWYSDELKALLLGFTYVDSLSPNPRGVTDWGVILNAARAGGKWTFLFGPHDYPFSTPLAMDPGGPSPVTFLGVNGFNWWAPPADQGFTRLRYTGTGSGIALESRAFSMRDIALCYSEDTFAGSLFHSTQPIVERCTFSSAPGVAYSAYCIIDLRAAVYGVFDKCMIAGGQWSIRGSSNDGTSFHGQSSAVANSITFSACVLQSAPLGMICNTGTDWLLDNCTIELFQGASTPASVCFTSDWNSTNGFALTLRDCNFWDCDHPVKIFAQPSAHVWSVKMISSTNHNGLATGVTAGSMIGDFQGNGAIQLLFNSIGNWDTDFGDATVSASKKSMLTLIGNATFDTVDKSRFINFENHANVTILGNSGGHLDNGNNQGVYDGYQTVGYELAAEQSIPSLTVLGGNTLNAAVSGDDSSGLIVIRNTAGSPTTTGAILDVIFGKAILGKNNPYNATRFAVHLSPFAGVAAAGGYTSSGPDTVAAQPYAVIDSNRTDGFSIAVTSAIAASHAIGVAYRVIHL